MSEEEAQERKKENGNVSKRPNSFMDGSVFSVQHCLPVLLPLHAWMVPVSPPNIPAGGGGHVQRQNLWLGAVHHEHFTVHAPTIIVTCSSAFLGW